MSVITHLTGLEILDSRARPTLKVTCRLASGACAAASVPSGASTGTAEALELRDGDVRRYRGLGCRKAVSRLGDAITPAVAGREFRTVNQLDDALLALDGTGNKSRLGANTMLAVSLAFIRAQAVEAGEPLYQAFAAVAGLTAPSTLPRPTINLFSGGRHAGGQVAIQDVLVVPAGARRMDEALAMTVEVYHCAAELCLRKYGTRALKADEGGLAPPFPHAEAMLEDAVAAVQAAGFKPGTEVALAVDVASTHFHRDGRYHLDGEVLAAPAMVERLDAWLRRYPIVSLEDGLAEDDWAHWPALRAAVSDRALVLGDDLLCTNPTRIRKAIEHQAANALLLKVNQVGTLSEAAEAAGLARAAGWMVTVSARSGETEDDWLADLAVGWGGDQIKIGSIMQSERLAKYNRLLELESLLGLPLAPWPGSFAG